ncbi:MAG: MFS transporter [Bacteroidales bacterium]
MMVNIGGFIGPFIAGFLYKVDWNLVFLMSIISIAINYILIFFFKEPNREPSDKTFGQNIVIAFKNIFVTLSDLKYLLFLFIIGIFWTAFNQLYYSFPVFIEHWINLDGLSQFFGLKAGTITAVTVTSMDAFFIIVLQMYISSVSMKYRPLNSMMTGIFILGAGLFLMFVTQNPVIMLAGVLIFAIGEMASSPKYTEYVGRIAPEDKKALYMGTSFLPVAMGHFLAGVISGKPYEVMSDKFYLLKKAIAENGFDIQPVSDSFSQTQYYQRAGELFGLDQAQLTQYLWDNYHPQKVWVMFTGLALLAAISLYLYDRYVLTEDRY